MRMKEEVVSSEYYSWGGTASGAMDGSWEHGTDSGHFADRRSKQCAIVSSVLD